MRERDGANADENVSQSKARKAETVNKATRSTWDRHPVKLEGPKQHPHPDVLGRQRAPLQLFLCDR
jgi:hypothetical protein